MTNLSPILSRKEIDDIVVSLADRISTDYKDRVLVLIGVLKGAFIFLADLVRHIRIPVIIDFMGASSYADQSASTGHIRWTKSIDLDIEGKDVLVIEDIIDTGLTLHHMIEHLKTLRPRSVKICALIDKRERRKEFVRVDYAGHILDEGFLVGYGLDYAEQYRNLPAIYHVTFSTSEDTQ